MKLTPLLLLALAGCSGCSSSSGATTVTLKGKQILVEWVRSDPDRRWIPMEHAPLSDGRGFLIGYGEARHMHHVTKFLEENQGPISEAGYDVVWTDQAGKIVEVVTLPAKSWEGVTSKSEVWYALFLPEGWVKSNGVAAGDMVEISEAIKSRPPDPLPTVTVGGVTFSVEMATSGAERQRGYMHRTAISRHNGMLFVYPQAGDRAFWMGNCHVPLDIAFFDEKGRFLNVVETDTYPDPKVDPGTRSRSNGPAKFILEVNYGLFKAKGLVDEKGNATKPLMLELSPAAVAAANAAN